LAVGYDRAPSRLTQLKQLAFQVSNVTLREIFVLAYEERDLVPKIFLVVILDAIPDALRFADVDGGFPCFWISPG